MATHKISSTQVFNAGITANQSLLEKYNQFVVGQKPNAIAWWLGSLMIHGCILVPVTFLLVYSLGGPVAPFLFTSMILFFINVVANMGGAAFRFTFNTFMVSILLHVLMVLIVLFTSL